MQSLLKQIDAKKRTLAHFEPFSATFLKNMEDWFRIELTYTSNAIEGNTLTRQETAQVVEKGLTVSGKTLVEQLEAVNHARALDYIATLRKSNRKKITEQIILEIHAHILKGIDDSNAGAYRDIPVRIAGSRAVMPNPLKVASLMRDFIKWLQGDLKGHPASIAADAHFRLVSIHPFTDGNGRTARLLMNLLLIQKKCPPALIRKEDRLEYIKAIEKGQLGKGMEDYYSVIYKGLIRSFDEILDLLGKKKKTSKETISETLLKIGELARKSGESVSSIRHWTKEGLLIVADKSHVGYQLYSRNMMDRIQTIRRLQNEERLTLAELKKKMGGENKQQKN